MNNFNDDFDFPDDDITLGALVDLRDQLTDLIRPKGNYSDDLLEKVDLALMKQLDKLIQTKN